MGGGGNGNHISIDNSTVYAAGSQVYSGSLGSDGAGIGGGGGGYGMPSSTMFNGNGGSGTDIKISGDKTDVIVLSGGIGGGAPGTHPTGNPATYGTGETIIENGNVLIYDTRPENKFYDATGIAPLYPLTFTVVNKDTGIGIPQTQITTGIDQALTRSDASNALTVAGFNLVGLDGSLFADGTATVWLSDGYDSFLFAAAGYEQLQLPDISAGLDEAVDSTDPETYGRNVNIPLTAISSPGTPGGSTIGGGTIVNPTNETKPVPEEPKNNTTPPTPIIPKEPDEPNESKSNISVFVIILMYILAIMTGIAAIYSENRRREQK